MKKPDGTAGDSWDEDTTMSVPPGNTHTMDECKRMYRWLENLEHNLQILDRRYRDYCDAAENASLRATELAECAECFASSRCAATPDPFHLIWSQIDRLTSGVRAYAVTRQSSTKSC